MTDEPLLSLRLSASYGGKAVLRDVSIALNRGEVLGLVGQSGSGKSTLAMAILRLLGYRGGTITGRIELLGRDLMLLSESEMRQVRGKEIGFVSQSPAAALNPALRLATHLKESWRAHAKDSPPVRTVLESVSLPWDETFLRKYPGELSVGQGQRFLIALGILHNPSLLLADEPTSALDVITQAEILRLFARLNAKRGMALLYISHDLLSIAALCHRVAILHLGEVVETGTAEQIFRNPRHAYTQSLVQAIPKNPFA